MVIESVGDAVAGVPTTASVIMNVFCFQPLPKNPTEAGVSGSTGAYTESVPPLGGGLFPPPPDESILFLQAEPTHNTQQPAITISNPFLNLMLLSYPLNLLTFHNTNVINSYVNAVCRNSFRLIIGNQKAKSGARIIREFRCWCTRSIPCCLPEFITLDKLC